MTRDELKAKIAQWAKRASSDDLPFDDFVDNAYQMVSREVRPQALDTMLQMDEETYPATVVRGGVYARTLPVDYLQAHEITNNGVRLRSKRPGYLQELASRDTINNPAFHAIVGNELWTAPGAGGDVWLTYNRRDTSLSAAETNYGLGAYPDVYLFASLRQLGIFEENGEMIATYEGEYNRRRDEINNEAMRSRRGAGAPGVS